MTLSFVWSALTAAVFAIACSRGMKFEELLRQDPLLVVAAFVVPPVVMFSERWRHPGEWAEMQRAANAATVVDMLAFRHIPDLRRPASKTGNS